MTKREMVFQERDRPFALLMLCFITEHTRCSSTRHQRKTMKDLTFYSLVKSVYGMMPKRRKAMPFLMSSLKKSFEEE